MKIEFWVFAENNAMSINRFLCQSIETFHAANQTVYLHLESKHAASTFDDLLWTFKDISFIPHVIFPQKDAVIIGYEPPGEKKTDIWINFSQFQPLFPMNCHSLIEIVYNDPIFQQSARARYKYYRELGFEINTQKRTLSP